jgi:hypothetical protein
MLGGICQVRYYDDIALAETLDAMCPCPPTPTLDPVWVNDGGLLPQTADCFERLRECFKMRKCFTMTSQAPTKTC